MTLRAAAMLTVLMAVLLGGRPEPAVAADLGALVTVEITSVQPANPAPGGRLEVGGVLRNNSAVSLRDVGVRMQVSTDPVTTPEEAVAVAAGGSVREGAVITQQPGFVTLAPGGETSFELSADVDDLGLTSPGVYEVRIDSVDGAADLLGTRSTTIQWFPPGSVAQPAEVVLLWPLVGTPARDAEDVFLSATPASELGRDGRLRTLLSVGGAYPAAVSWVLDPQTLQSATLLFDDHLALGPDGTVAVQPGDPAAGAWLDQLRQATSGAADVTAAGYADPDSPAEVSAGLLSDLVLATTTAAAQVTEQLGRPVRGGFSWPPEGHLDQPTLDALRGAGVQHVVLAADAVSNPTDSPLLTLSTDSGPITGVIGDADLSAALRTLTARPAEAVAGRQLFLSLVALRSGAGTGPTVVATPPGDWAPAADAVESLLAALTTAEYAEPRSLSAALTAGSAAPESELAATAAIGTAAPLTDEYLAGVAAAGDTLAEIGDIAVQPGESLRGFREALLRSSSARWRPDPAMGALLLDRTNTQIVAQRDRVRISSAGIVSFPGEQGRVPVTVSNDLTVAVTVGLTLSATPSYRIEPAPIEPVTVPPGQRLSLEVPVRVVGSNPLVVTAQLLTPQGKPYGPGEPFTLRTSAYSRVAAWAVGLAFAALIVMAAASILRRVRTSGDGDSDG